jgi:hypothetical protein
LTPTEEYYSMMATHIYLFTLTLLTITTPLASMQRIIHAARETQLPWKHCLARMAAATLSQLIIHKAYKLAAYPKSPDDWQKLKKIVTNFNELEQTPQEEKELHDAFLAISACAGATLLHELIMFFFDQKLTTTRLSTKHYRTYLASHIAQRLLFSSIQNGIHSLDSHVPQNRMIKKLAKPTLLAASLAAGYYTPPIIDRSFTGRTTQTPSLRLMRIAQQYGSAYIASKII